MTFALLTVLAVIAALIDLTVSSTVCKFGVCSAGFGGKNGSPARQANSHVMLRDV